MNTPLHPSTSVHSRSYKRRERLLKRWRLSTVLAAVVALVAVGAVLATAISLGGFGIPTDSAPKQVSSGAVPFGLLRQESPPTHPVKPPVFPHPVQLWFINPGGLLTPVLSPTSTAHPTLALVLDKLLAGTGALPAGSPSDLETAIPVGTTLLGAKVSKGLATIDLSSDIEGASGELLIQAFAQIVFTATTGTACPSKPTTKTTIAKALPQPPGNATPNSALLPCANKGVVFEVDGQHLQIPIATGAQTSRPVTTSDYSSLG